MPQRPLTRIALLLVLAGAAIGIAGALFSGEEAVARDPFSQPASPTTRAADPHAIDDGSDPDPGADLPAATGARAGGPSTATSPEAPGAGDTRPAAVPTPAAPEMQSPEAPSASDSATTPAPTAPQRQRSRATPTDTTPPAPAPAGGPANLVATTVDAGNPVAGAATAPTGPDAATTVEPATTAVAAELIERLRPLVAEPDPATPAYDRRRFAGWLDDDGDCVNTRHEILQAEAVDYVMNAEGCAVATGEWFDHYTDRTYTDPRDLDVDHVVALADAWVSGAWAWADELLDRFSNDLGNLNAIAAGENRSKSVRGPADYRPTAPAARCEYLVQYATVKIRWDLSITAEDFAAVAAGLTDCDVNSVPDAGPAVVP